MKTIFAFCAATVLVMALWGATEVLATPPSPAVEAVANDQTTDPILGAISDNRQLFPMGGRLTPCGGFDPQNATRFEVKLQGKWDTRTGQRIRPIQVDWPASVRSDQDVQAD
jgi:hypothetical protein